MACDPELIQNLADARKAYHSLMTGQMARVVVDQNGEKVEFQSANRGNLYSYIQSLEAEVALCSELPPPLYVNNGPAGFVF